MMRKPGLTLPSYLRPGRRTRDDGATRASVWRCAAALAASASVHVLAVAWLIAPAHAPASIGPPVDPHVLAVLVAPALPPEPVHVERSPEPVAPAPPPDLRPEIPRPALAHPAVPRHDPVPGLPLAKISTDVPYALLGDDFTARMLRDFPVEVSTPVKLPESLQIRYPRFVDDDPIQRSVILWIIVDENGKPEEMHLVQGGGMLAQAAIDALGTARYEPATNFFGQRVRHHIIVDVEFPEARNAPSPGPGTAATAKAVSP